VKNKFKKINSTNIEDLIKELDKKELEYNNVGFTNIRDIYVCPECVYLGEKCSRCSS
jgi:uncharacterized protein (DUF2225 family)